MSDDGRLQHLRLLWVVGVVGVVEEDAVTVVNHFFGVLTL